jgi:uncharacterized membrane protein
MPDDAPEPSFQPGPRTARAVPVDHALAWYREAMRLWRRGPLTFATLAAIVLAADLALSLIPGVGVLIAQIAVPLVACGLLFASLAADRGGRPRIADLAGVVAASPGALAAIVASAAIVFAVEALIAQATAQINLLAPGGRDAELGPSALLAIYAVGVAVSLPFTFVPFAALFDRLPFSAAFAQSLQGFARNPAPFALYGALSLVLLLFGWATFGLGLLLVLPWWAASSYAAWKDVFAVAEPTRA